MPFKEAEDDDLLLEDDSKKAIVHPYTNIKDKMKAKVEDLSLGNLTMLPARVYIDVKHWANETYGGNWVGLREHQVVELVRKCHKKLGLDNTIGTIENTPDYNKMTNQDRPFLHASMCFPHPDASKNTTTTGTKNNTMRAMMFANPELLGLLNGRVDIFVDVTFSCAPDPFTSASSSWCLTPAPVHMYQ